MTVSRKTLFVAAVGVLTMCIAAHALAAGGNDLPVGLVIQDAFAPGLGAPVGSVRAVEGEALIIHAGAAVGYRAAGGLPLFKGDTIIAREGGKIQFALSDGSQMTLSSGTKLVITQSMYDKAKNARASFIDMSVGKARFLVTKLVGSGSLDFKVKTETAVCGVRGSDFIVAAVPQYTEATALQDTSLSVASLAYPDEKPVILSDYTRCGVKKGELPSEVVRVTPEEIERMLEEFRITPTGAEGEKPAGAEGKPVAGGILLPASHLVPPELPGEEAGEGVFALPDFMKDEHFKWSIQSIIDQHEAISAEKGTDNIKESIWQQELPDMPDVPEAD